MVITRQRHIVDVGKNLIPLLHEGPPATDPYAATDTTVFIAPACLLMLTIFAGVWYVLRPRGAAVCARAMSYIGALVVTQLLMKELISQPVNFRFPSLVTALHIFVVWSITIIHFAVRGELGKCNPSSLGSSRRYYTHVLPAACTFFPSVVMSNQALLYIGVGLNAAVATMSPVATATLTWIAGRSFTMGAWSGIGLACCGAVLIGFGEVRGGIFKDQVGTTTIVTGLCLAGGAVLFRASKVVLQDMLMKPSAYDADPNKNKIPDPDIDPMHIWTLQAPPCFLLAITYGFFMEDPFEAWKQLSRDAMIIIIASSVSATILNLTAMYAIRDLGGSMMSIIGKLNTVVVMSFAMVFLGERLPRAVLCGAVLVLGGVYRFERAESANSPTASIKADTDIGEQSR